MSFSTSSTFRLGGACAAFAVVFAGCNLTSPRFYGGIDINAGGGGNTTWNAGGGSNAAVVTPAGNGSGAVSGGAVAGVVSAPPGAPPAVQLDAVTQTLRAQGYVPVSAPQRAAQAAGGLSSHPFMPSQPGVCYVAVAVGAPTVTQLAMTISAPSGQYIGNYARGDSHPWVQFCAYEYGLYFPRVFVGQGNGEVLFQIFQGQPGTSAMLAGVWSGGSQQRVAPRSVDAATQSRIAALTQQLRGQGYQQVVAPRASMLGRGEIVSLPTTLRAGFCYTFAIFGGPGARDADLYFLDSTGTVVQRDERADVDAVVRDVCVTNAAQYTVRPRMAEGDGPVWIAAFARSAQASTAQVSQTSLSMSQGSGGGNDIDDTWNGQQNNLLSVGYQADGAPLNRTLTEGQSADENVTLGAGMCYAIMAVGESRVRDLDLDLLDSSGRPVDRDYAQDPKAIVRLCAPAQGQYRVTVRMASGGGAYRLGLFRWNGGTSGAGLSGIAFVRNAEVTRVLQSDGYAGDADFEIFRAQIREGANTTRNVTLRASQCYAFVGVGGNGVSDLDLVVQKDGQTVAEDRTFTAFPTARFCARNAGQHRVTISSRRGSGEFVFRVFRREQN
ncbi:MAG: hypothetical protein JNK05_32015 [Myxococcales bacterium]|nr:hypothetical protein [Myxococcales bacterium]